MEEEHNDEWQGSGLCECPSKSGFIQMITHGKRNEETANEFIGQVKTNSNSKALILEYGFLYETPLKVYYCDREP